MLLESDTRFVVLQIHQIKTPQVINADNPMSHNEIRQWLCNHLYKIKAVEMPNQTTLPEHVLITCCRFGLPGLANYFIAIPQQLFESSDWQDIYYEVY